MKPALFLILAAAAAAAPRSVWDGVYSTDQAARGQKLYVAQCVKCHGEDLRGGPEDSPPLIEQSFLKRWHNKAVGRLVDATRRTMPPDSPGELSREQSTDIIAYLLSANGFPAGKTELPSDVASLREIMIEPKKE